MTRVAPVGSLAAAAPTATRKTAAKGTTNDPFADALMDLLAAIPQPTAKPRLAPAQVPVAATGDDATRAGDAAAADPATADPAAAPALLQAAAPPVDPGAPAPQDAATGHETSIGRATRLALGGGVDGRAPLDAIVAATTSNDPPPDDGSAVSADRTVAAATSDATVAAIQAGAAFALALGAAGLVARAVSPDAGRASAPVPAPAAAATPTDPAPAASTGAPGAGDVHGAIGANGDPAQRSLFSAALLQLEARWSPPAAEGTRTPGRSTSTAPASDTTAGDVSASASDGGSGVVGDAVLPAAAAPPPPPPDALAQLLADTVRQVSTSSDATPAASPATHSRHAGSSGDGVESTAAAPPAAAPVAAPQGAAALAAVAAPAAPLLNGTPLATANLDPGPRPSPEPKAAPAPTAHATLELDVDKTGASRIRIAVQGSQVRATITASEIGAASLDRQLPELRRSLEERGFSDVRLTVHTQDQSVAAPASANASADDTQSFSRNPSNQQSQRWAQQQDTGDGAGSQRRRREKEEQA